MATTDWTAWLGDAADDTTPEQIERLDAASTLIEERYPHKDLEDSRRDALWSAYQVIVGDDTTEAVAAAWLAARKAERDAHAALTGAIIADDRNELRLSTALGLSRPTIRKARGK